MGKRYRQLCLEERNGIARLYEAGQTLQQIATTLDRSASTISRELKRNISKTKGYDPVYAQQQTRSRRWRGSRLERQPELRNLVIDRLAMGWSPTQISGRLALLQDAIRISHESIYRFIYAQIRRTKDYSWRRLLPRGKSKRGFRGRKGGSAAHFIPHRVSIHQRPKHVKNRKQAGHWEADLMLFSQYGQAVLAVCERHSRFLMVTRQPSKAALPVAEKLYQWFAMLPQTLRKTVTFDNGTEFTNHSQLHELSMKTYFCDTYSPWQKGSVENAIGRMRRFLPRKTDLAMISDQHMLKMVQQYNHTPRKCLGFRTPAEVFAKLLHFECESTPRLKRG